jgi:hypothetical protein
MCPLWGCGTNSPTVGDGVVFDEVDSSAAHMSKVEITSANLKGGPAVTLQVRLHTLIAIDGNGNLYEGSKLEGTTFNLHAMTDSGESREYELTIEQVGNFDVAGKPKILPFWAGNPFWAGKLEAVPYYLIKGKPKGSNCTPVPICKVNPPSGLLPPADPFFGFEDQAIAFEGDHYDAKYKAISGPDFDTKFNLACAGAAPAKMHLMRHTSAGGWTGIDMFGNSDNLAYPTTWQERQAMLKMFTADYCGTGTSFTVDDQPLHYVDWKDWYPNTTALPSITNLDMIEAYWDENGAVCLDEPRPAVVPPNTTPVSRMDVEQECSKRDPPKVLQYCTGDGGWLTTGHTPWYVISTVPPGTGAP